MTDVMSTFTVRGLKEALSWLTPKQTALIRGRHGIGKSAIAYQMKKVWGIDKVIERRLSQLSEGDMIGLPDRGAIKKNGEHEHLVTKFLPTDWMLEAEFEPCIVFLDEINRGTPETMQACFQFIEKGELNGRKIHPESRIIAAINFSKEYHVNPLDPAFLDRFWVADLEPDKQDWLDWARTSTSDGGGGISEEVIDFISQCNEDHFEIMPDKQAQLPAHEITPSRRSWERFDRHINQVRDGKKLIELYGSPVLYDIGRGFLGPDASRAFINFLRDRDTLITPEEIINGFEKVKKRVLKLKPDVIIALIDKIKHYVSSNNIKLTEQQALNIGMLHKALPPELAQLVWAAFSDGDHDNIKVVYKYVAKHMLATFSETAMGQSLKKAQAEKK